jgi:hypothetical protein
METHALEAFSGNTKSASGHHTKYQESINSPSPLPTISLLSPTNFLLHFFAQVNEQAARAHLAADNDALRPPAAALHRESAAALAAATLFFCSSSSSQSASLISSHLPVCK